MIKLYTIQLTEAEFLRLEKLLTNRIVEHIEALSCYERRGEEPEAKGVEADNLHRSIRNKLEEASN